MRGAPRSTASSDELGGARCRAGDADRIGVAERLGRQPVLAVPAVQIAAQHAEGERVGAGQGVEERFLLDRVALQRAHVAAGDLEQAVSWKRTRQTPSRPSGIRHRWPQAKQRRRPSSRVSTSALAAGTVRLARAPRRESERP